jgi:hypothetical protein
MAAIFPKSSDIILKVLGLVVGLGVVSGVAGYLSDGDGHRVPA